MNRATCKKSVDICGNITILITMSRKVFVEVKVRLVINADEGVDIGNVINEADYNFTSQTEGAEIEDTEILDHEITDSK